jgi:hypothetical protein
VDPADEKKALQEHIVMVGYGTNDPPIRHLLIDELVSMDNQRRTKFLDLVTSYPRLPPGGLPQAGIKIAAARAGVRTVWAQTCARTLYLPNYGTSEQVDCSVHSSPLPSCAAPTPVSSETCSCNRRVAGFCEYQKSVVHCMCEQTSETRFFIHAAERGAGGGLCERGAGRVP